MVGYTCMNREKHKKQKQGYKMENTSAYLDQHPILGDKGMIYITPYSNGKWYSNSFICGLIHATISFSV